MRQESQQELAAERTDLALARTLLAKQRTFVAWVRTGLSSMSVGFAIVKLLPEAHSRWLVVTLGCFMIGVGGFMQAIGFGGYYKAFKRLGRAESIAGAPPWMLAVIAGVLLLCAVIMFVLVVQV